MRLIPLVFLSALLHLYIGMRLVPALPDGAATLAAAVLLAISAVLMPLGLVARSFARQPLADRLTWVGMGFMGLFSSLLVFTLVRDLVLLLATAASALGLAAPASLQEGSALAVLALAALATLWGFVNARRTARVVRVDVPLRGLPPELHGFRIAQISDIHVGPTIKRGYLLDIVRAVNGLEADMVAITGDLVDGSVGELADHVAPLAALASRHGSFFVTGNHEYYSGAPAWIAELRRLGVRVLLNEHELLHHDGARLLLAGVTDFGAHHYDRAQRSDPHAALAGAPTEALVKVLLAHQPRSATVAAEAGFDLQLSGHTHGGQFFPWNLMVRLQQPFTAGLHRLDALWVYTSRGTGYWGPPKRFGAPSEITLLRLVAH